MKIEVDDKYLPRNLYIFAGNEPILRKRGEHWERKKINCVRCGNCCRAIREDHPLGTPDGCKHIEDQGSEFLCGLGWFRPYGCAVSEMVDVGCVVEWEEVK